MCTYMPFIYNINVLKQKQNKTSTLKRELGIHPGYIHQCFRPRIKNIPESTMFSLGNDTKTLSTNHSHKNYQYLLGCASFMSYKNGEYQAEIFQYFHGHTNRMSNFASFKQLMRQRTIDNLIVTLS